MASQAPKSEHPADHKDDLSTILSAEERVELTLLIANIAELMRQKLLNIFNAEGEEIKPLPPITSKNPNVNENEPREETEEEAKARKLRENREKELSAPKMLELKKDALEFFDKWRESLLARAGTAVNNSKGLVEEQKVAASMDAPHDVGPPSEPKVLRESRFSFVFSVFS